MTLTPNLIVFDCDGTLADSQHMIVEAMRLAFQNEGLAAPARPAILRTIGLSLTEALQILAADQYPDKRNLLARSYREWCLTLRRQPNAEEPLFPGAASLLFKLAAEENLLLGIATGKSSRGVARFIEQNGLKGLFATIQTADNAPSKPHPAMLLQAMAETGTAPEATVMIGDTSHDMIMAACANVAGIGVSWGYHSAGDLQRAGAKTVVNSFAALEGLLTGGEAVQFEAVA